MLIYIYINGYLRKNVYSYVKNHGASDEHKKNQKSYRYIDNLLKIPKNRAKIPANSSG